MTGKKTTGWIENTRNLFHSGILLEIMRCEDKYLGYSPHYTIDAILTSQEKRTVKKLKLDSSAPSQIREDRMRIERKIQQLISIIDEAKARLEASQNLSSSERLNLESFVEEETKIIESLKRKISGPMD